MTHWGIYWLTTHPRSHGPLSFLHHAVLHNSFFRTAAFLWAAGTADIAAANLWAALAAANTEEQEQEEGTNDDEQHHKPMVDDELDFFVRVTSGIARSINSTVVNPIVPPHHLIYHQVCLILYCDLSLPIFRSQSWLIASPLLDNDPHRPLTVWTVIRRVLSQLQRRLVRCRVVLQDRILAERLKPPGDNNFLEVCRSGVITAQDY